MNPVNGARTSMPSPMRQFIFLSLTAHIALLAIWHYPVSLSVAGAPDNVLSITLAETTLVPVPSRTPSAQVSRDDRLMRHAAREPLAANHSRPAGLGETATVSVKQSAAVSPDKGETPAAEVLARIQSRLLTSLARHFHYPMLARQRGWEGTVLLGLRVESDGHLDKLRIERSSGYAVLDHSALNSLSRLGHLAEASHWLNGRGMDMQLPVIYRLVEN